MQPKSESSGEIDYSGGDDASIIDIVEDLSDLKLYEPSSTTSSTIGLFAHQPIPEIWNTPKEKSFYNGEKSTEKLIEDIKYVEGIVPPVCRQLTLVKGADGEFETPPSTRIYPQSGSEKVGFKREALLLRGLLDSENYSSDDEIRKQVAEAAEVQESEITPTPFLKDDEDPIVLYPSETEPLFITEGEPPQRIDEGEEGDMDDKGIVIPAHYWKACLAGAVAVAVMMILGLTSELSWISTSLTPAAAMPTAPPTTILPSPVVASIQTVKTYTHCRFFNGDRPVGNDGRHIIVCDEGAFTADNEYQGSGVMKFYNFTPY